jgi:plastocyanin
MILKTVIIVISVAAIVLTSMVIAGVIIVGQILENDPNIRNEMRQWLEAGGENSGQNSQEERSSSFSSSSSSSSPPPTEEGNVAVSIVGNSGSNSYNPNPIEIKVGDTVTWINNDSSPHTVTSSSSSNDDSSIITFDSGVLRRGETFSFTFDLEGEYPYFCTLHPNMVGTVVVIAS